MTPDLPKIFKALACACLLASLSGCAGTPWLPQSAKTLVPVPTLADVETHIQCEIYRSMKSQGLVTVDAKGAETSTLDYVVSVSLALETTNEQSFSPAFSFSNTPLLGLGGRVGGEQHKSVNHDFSLRLGDLVSTGAGDRCQSDGEKSVGIKGELGINEILQTGLERMKDGNSLYQPVKPESANPDTIPTFGATIDFTLVYGANAGLSWQFKNFKGPSEDLSLYSVAHTGKDTLVISFAPNVPAAQEPPSKDVAAGAPPPAPGQLPFAAASIAVTEAVNKALSEVREKARADIELTPEARTRARAAEEETRTASELAVKALLEATQRIEREQAPLPPSAVSANQANITRMILQGLRTGR